MKPEWHVYILQCGDDTLYTGSTNDLESRIEKHKSGKGAKYTRSRKVLGLLYSERCKGRSAALKRENEIKSLSRSEKFSLMNL
ncbi:MAG: GIY-YIG nuclease family protein [Pseudomonadota bacterium]